MATYVMIATGKLFDFTGKMYLKAGYQSKVKSGKPIGKSVKEEPTIILFNIFVV